jgi:CO dehydrogenase maturation factor
VAFAIALSGKGGMGKTTLAALMVRHLSRVRGKAVLAVDADPNTGLGEALGVSPEHTLADIREDTREDRLQLSAGMSKERHVELLIQSCLVEGNKFDLLTMGRPEGPKCYCYVNNLLRKYLDEATKEYPVVVIDNEAGMEHLSRRTTNNVDDLFVVSDATRQGARTVGRIMKLADSLPILVKRKEVLLNHVVPGADAADFRGVMREAGFSVALEVPYDRDLYQTCAAGKPVFDLPDSSEALLRLGKFLDERVP